MAHITFKFLRSFGCLTRLRLVGTIIVKKYDFGHSRRSWNRFCGQCRWFCDQWGSYISAIVNSKTLTIRRDIVMRPCFCSMKTINPLKQKGRQTNTYLWNLSDEWLISSRSGQLYCGETTFSYHDLQYDSNLENTRGQKYLVSSCKHINTINIGLLQLKHTFDLKWCLETDDHGATPSTITETKFCKSFASRHETNTLIKPKAACNGNRWQLLKAQAIG